MVVRVYFDGACEPKNPRGVATYGFVIYKDGRHVHQGYGLAVEPFSELASNNVAEYTGMIKALEWLIENGYTDEHVNVFGDSQLTIYQMQRVYSVKAWRIKPLYQKATELVSKFKHVEFHWIPREENLVADDLSHRAFEELLEREPNLFKKLEPYLATEKQRKFMDKLGIKYNKYITKGEASRLIKRKLKQLGKS